MSSSQVRSMRARRTPVRLRAYTSWPTAGPQRGLRTAWPKGLGARCTTYTARITSVTLAGVALATRLASPWHCLVRHDASKTRGLRQRPLRRTAVVDGAVWEAALAPLLGTL